MLEKLLEFIKRHDFFILTTHDPADADGLGAQLALACILRDKEKRCRIINASPIPEHFKFMDPQGLIEYWDKDKHGALPEQSALFIVDTADEYNIGQMRDVFLSVREVFVIDHHEPKSHAALPGINDASAASTCEITAGLAEDAGVTLDPDAAFAAYTGIAYDTGFFAYPKTGPRTLRAAMTLLTLGANSNDTYRHLCENVPTRRLLLQRKAIASMSLYCKNKVAAQILRSEDFSETGALPEDTDGLVNFPLKAYEIVISFLIKETPDKKVRCSLRSKGSINVAKIAQRFDGGGHLNAAGFKSKTDINNTLAQTLAHITELLEKQ